MQRDEFLRTVQQAARHGDRSLQLLQQASRARITLFIPQFPKRHISRPSTCARVADVVASGRHPAVGQQSDLGTYTVTLAFAEGHPDLGDLAGLVGQRCGFLVAEHQPRRVHVQYGRDPSILRAKALPSRSSE